MTTEKPAVAFIGLGAMGFGMATHLLKQGYPVTGFDVWPPTLERFRQAGGAVAASPADAVRDKPFCVCMVATAQQAQAVLVGPGADKDKEGHPAVPALPRGATLLLCSTVPCAYVQGLAAELKGERLGRGDVHLVDCPVSGGTRRAAAGTLSIMAGGTDEALARADPLLRAMADPRKLYLVAGGVGAGSNMKMCHQVLAANQILSAGEALGLARHLGLDPFKAADAGRASAGRSWMFEDRLPRLLAQYDDRNAFHGAPVPVSSAVTIILKDAGIITSEARRCAFPTPMTSVAEQAYLAALGRGWGAEDDTSVLRLYGEGVGKVGPLAPGPLAARTDEDKAHLVADLLQGIHLCSAAETIAFASHVGLDLDQVFELCVNAAGGSFVLETLGPGMIDAVKRGRAGAGESWAAPEGDQGLADLTLRLQAAVDEAQRLKMPLFLGTQALTLLRLASKDNGTDAGGAPKHNLASASVVKVWLSSKKRVDDVSKSCWCGETQCTQQR